MLKRVMRLNALSCAAFGALFILFPASVALFLGDPPALLLQGLGLALIVNAAHLIFEAARPRPRRAAVFYFVAGDMLWVIGSLALVAGGLFVTTPRGRLATLAVALMVGVFGLLQARHLPPKAGEAHPA